ADARLLRSACEYAAELGLVVQTHSEDPALRADGVMNEGSVSHDLGLPANPDSAEAVMLFRDGEIARMTGARMHLAHVSTCRCLQVAQWLKAAGASNTVAVTPHHLTLSDDLLTSFVPLFKVAPPLRTRTDVAYLRAALKSTLIDAIGTDHAPHTLAEKQRDMIEAPFGIGNIEVAFPLLYSELVAGGELPLSRLLELLQDGPAAVMGWPAPRLTPGAPADVVVLDLDTTRPVEPAGFLSKAKHSPWEGVELGGWPTATVVDGVLAFGG